MTISEAQAEQLRATRYPVCPACQRPTFLIGERTILEIQDGISDNAWFARCQALKGLRGFFRGMLVNAETEVSDHLNRRLGERA